ncbi:alpha-(1,3)-fucosyltransferase 4-like [Thamnophis elegans]|uniref:alpha-(1,3)-fucosyltransferase 4-like n=1 Tax=Thamnophis elegans TaxID=35005 RepID=UPI001376FACC|nr:alpha-(1,3)-fucosyltransferase 4-like [Thamnophis elegans]
MRASAGEAPETKAGDSGSRIYGESNDGGQPWKKFVYVEPPRRVREVLEEELYFQRDECRIRHPSEGAAATATNPHCLEPPKNVTHRGQKQGAQRWGCRREAFFAAAACCTLIGWYTASSVKDARALQSPWREEKDPEAVTVLVWWVPFRSGGRVAGGCMQFNISACRLSANRSLLPQAHAILFHHRDLQSHGLARLPRQRPRDQRWVWMNFESPSHTGGLRDLGSLFHWTMSYRADSDVFVPYGYLQLCPEPLVQLALPKKTKLVAWVISNWNEDQARVGYYHQLRRYLPIHVYGSHGLRLMDNNVVKTISEYKFYLAFENSQHKDYIYKNYIC